jgi:hypothetical protein
MYFLLNSYQQTFIFRWIVVEELKRKESIFLFFVYIAIRSLYWILFLIYSLFLTLTYADQCSFKTPIKQEDVYLYREKLNSTSIRVWLYLKFNQSEYTQNFFSYYTFTLRIIHLIDEHEFHLEDRFEK